MREAAVRGRRDERGPCSIRGMHTVLQAAVYDVTVPVVIGVVTFALLAAALGFVRQVGKGRPHAK